ncbi:hypothetical protein [Anaeromassilibacillus senegalensis]|uniref:hypothetical protein n=1 Tax=Anaeromassilibacillus senegalensis TaxID=1673717 RepID=UPI000682A2B5|nr:hypothetical protein [Anaeromassilibacillus senegalensis]
MIETHIAEEPFHFIQEKDKIFIIEFTKALEEMGYTYGGEIGSGYCWGKYMLIFRKANVKSKNVVARIYIKDDSIVLRLFFNHVTKHAAYISASPAHIQNAFTGDYGTCKHCKGDSCKFRKDYEIDGVKYEKCNGTTFEFHDPKIENLAYYLALFKEFYPLSKKRSIPDRE